MWEVHSCTASAEMRKEDMQQAATAWFWRCHVHSHVDIYFGPGDAGAPGWGTKHLRTHCQGAIYGAHMLAPGAPWCRQGSRHIPSSTGHWAACRAAPAGLCRSPGALSTARTSWTSLPSRALPTLPGSTEKLKLATSFSFHTRTGTRHPSNHQQSIPDSTCDWTILNWSYISNWYIKILRMLMDEQW